MGQHSGIGVLDKAVAVLGAVAARPCTLAELCSTTGLPRATAHRLAVGLETHRLLTRPADGRWYPGPALRELATGAVVEPLLAAATVVLPRLRDITGESVQLYRREGDVRVCIATAEPPAGLRDTVPVGARLPMTAGSGAKVLRAWSGTGWSDTGWSNTGWSNTGWPDADWSGTGWPDADRSDAGPSPTAPAFSPRALAEVRRRGWAQSVAEREPGVASVSAPVRGPGGAVLAAVSVSGPVERIGRRPGVRWAADLLAAAEALRRHL